MSDNIANRGPRPTGDAAEDAKNFIHPVKDPENDARVAIRQDRMEKLREVVIHGTVDKEFLKELKLTNKEKSALLHDPDFLVMLDAKLFNLVFNLEEIDKRFLDLMRIVLMRLGLLTKNNSIGKPNVNMRARQIIINKPNGAHQDAIDVTD